MREQEQRLSNGLCSCRAGKSAGHLFEHCRMCAKVAQTFTEAQTHVPRTLHQDRLTTAMPILFVLFRLVSARRSFCHISTELCAHAGAKRRVHLDYTPAYPH